MSSEKIVVQPASAAEASSTLSQNEKRAFRRLVQRRLDRVNGMREHLETRDQVSRSRRGILRTKLQFGGRRGRAKGPNCTATGSGRKAEGGGRRGRRMAGC
jgi:hypothetical protein